MAMREGKGTQNHQNMVKIIYDKLVDSQIELNSSEFWFCYEVKSTGNFAYFVVSANLSKHTMHHQHKLGRVHFREKKLSKYQNIIEHTPQHQSLSSSPLQPACVWWRPFLICWHERKEVWEGSCWLRGLLIHFRLAKRNSFLKTISGLSFIFLSNAPSAYPSLSSSPPKLSISLSAVSLWISSASHLRLIPDFLSQQLAEGGGSEKLLQRSQQLSRCPTGLGW